MSVPKFVEIHPILVKIVHEKTQISIWNNAASHNVYRGHSYIQSNNPHNNGTYSCISDSYSKSCFHYKLSPKTLILDVEQAVLSDVSSF